MQSADILSCQGCKEPFSSRVNSNVLNLQQYPELKNLWVRLENGHQILVIGGSVTIQTFIDKAVDLSPNLGPLGEYPRYHFPDVVDDF